MLVPDLGYLADPLIGLPPVVPGCDSGRLEVARRDAERNRVKAGVRFYPP